MGSRTLNPATTAEAFLELLADRGIDVFLGNAGTDFASLVEQTDTVPLSDVHDPEA